ncbi:MAG: hemN [Parachlamydiales bacterium]|nr:hemN [Parachlamydiales bacterium]
MQSQFLSHRIVSIYFGGGTPTLFADGVMDILEKVRDSGIKIAPHCEITIEANPDKLDRARLTALRGAGMNRISIGVQSLDDSSLQTLERLHSAKKAKDAIFEAHAAGFENISIDLMIDIPHQTLESLQGSLAAIQTLPIQHCSLYNLTIEPHTSFFLRRKAVQEAMPNEGNSLRLLQTAVSGLQELSFTRYEISAFAKKGFESVHNTGYWIGRPFLGFGPSAFSYWEGRRFKNVAHLQRYARALRNQESTIEFEETLPYPANVNERLAIQLRLMHGVADGELQLPDETIAQLHRLQSEGYLMRDHDRWKLTDQGTLFYDTVAENLISDEPPCQPQDFSIHYKSCRS